MASLEKVKILRIFICISCRQKLEDIGCPRLPNLKDKCNIRLACNCCCSFRWQFPVPLLQSCRHQPCHLGVPTAHTLEPCILCKPISCQTLKWYHYLARKRYYYRSFIYDVKYGKKCEGTEWSREIWCYVVTYIVPAIRVLMWDLSSSLSLANPKSEILGFRSLSRSTLVALISLCTILSFDSSWRKAKPLAIPIHILNLVGQSSSNWLFFEPKIKKRQPQYCKHQRKEVKALSTNLPSNCTN